LNIHTYTIKQNRMLTLGVGYAVDGGGVVGLAVVGLDVVGLIVVGLVVVGSEVVGCAIEDNSTKYECEKMNLEARNSINKTR